MGDAPYRAGEDRYGEQVGGDVRGVELCDGCWVVGDEYEEAS